jgi:hypothetical protein
MFKTGRLFLMSQNASTEFIAETRSCRLAPARELELTVDWVWIKMGGEFPEDYRAGSSVPSDLP